MANLYVQEYAGLQEDISRTQMQSPGDLIAHQKLAIGGSSVASAEFDSRTRFLMLVSDADCQYALGDTPTADGDSRYLPAGVFFSLSTEKSSKIAVIAKQ